MTTVTHALDAPTDFGGKLALFARDIKISHTVFAMPWAILAAVLAWHRTGGAIIGKLALIVLCMITARTAAMASNRMLDAGLDRLNPRTARRALPSGRLSVRFVWLSLCLCAGLFLFFAFLFEIFYHNPWPTVFSVPVLTFICAYPLLKRFSRLCHYYLGMALALAPVCAWIAIAGDIAQPPLLMFGAVLCWTAGFDIIYATQDYQSDLQTGVVSVPVKFGIGRSLWLSRLTHAIAFAMLVMLGVKTPELSHFYFVGVAAAGMLLIIEHWLVRADDLSKVNMAFFTINGIISLLIGTLGVIDVFLSR